MVFKWRKRKRPVCFIHIGKTGGTTLLGVFEKILNASDICPVRHMEEIEQVPSKDIEGYLLYRGHFWYSVEKYLPNKTAFFTVLRDPVERSISTYDHIRTFSHGRHEVVKNMSLEEYVDSPNHVSLEVDNWQTRVLSSCIDPSQTPSLEIALNRMALFPMVGITEQLKETVDLMSVVFDWPQCSGFDTKNVTSDRTERSEINKSTLERIRQKNALDCVLYESAQRQFESLKERYL